MNEKDCPLCNGTGWRPVRIVEEDKTEREVLFPCLHPAPPRIEPILFEYDTVDDDRQPWTSWGKVSKKPLRKDCFLCHKLLAEGEVIVCAECNPNPYVVVGSGLGHSDE